MPDLEKNKTTSIKTTSIDEGVRLFNNFFTNDLSNINLIIKEICDFTLDKEVAPAFANVIVDRYKNGGEEFADWQNGVGPELTSDQQTNLKSILDKPCIPTFNVPATAFNDLYKWTMMPVIRDMEKRKTTSTETNPIIVTFKVDLRDKFMNEQIKTNNDLREQIFTNLKKLQQRTFHTYYRCLDVADKNEAPFDTMLDNWLTSTDAKTIKLVEGKVLCNNGENYNDRDLDLTEINKWRHINSESNVSTLFNSLLDSNEVNINFFKSKEDEEYYIEATGPWHKVTWLETSMMQTVYETVLRYNLILNKVPYIIWLGDALLRCAMSISSVKNAEFDNLKGALFTGRRTGGFLFLVLQNYMYELNFEQFAPRSTPSSDMKFSLGSSSCDSILILKDLNLRKAEKPIMPAGTHAHELSMVISALYPELDIIRPATTQIIGHYLYYKLSMHSNEILPRPVPALPDTIGTNVFLNAALSINIEDKTKDNSQKIGKFFDKIDAFRQDSGKMEDFPKKVTKCDYVKGIMASEIENLNSILEAKDNNYTTFGAGGFFGDSAKVWTHPNAHSNSMAAKAIRVLTSDNKYSLLLKDNIEIKNLINDIVFDKPCPEFIDAKSVYFSSHEENLEDFTKFPIKTGDNDYKTCETSSKLALDKNASLLAQNLKIEIAKSAQENYKTKFESGCNIDEDIALLFNEDNTIELLPMGAEYVSAGGKKSKKNRIATKRRRPRKTKKKHRKHKKQQSKKQKKRMTKILKSKNKKQRRQSNRHKSKKKFS